MSDQKRTPRQGAPLPGKSLRPSAPAGSTAVPKGSGAKPPAPRTAPPVRNNPATRSIPVIKPQSSASNGRPGPTDPADRSPGSAQPAKPAKPAKPGKSGRGKGSGAKRPAAANQSGVPKGLLGSKGGAKRPAVRPGPGAKKNSSPADEPTSNPAAPQDAQAPTSPEAGANHSAGTGQTAGSSTPSPARSPETSGGTVPAEAALPDLSAHTDAPAWLSPDGAHDAELWDGAFDAESQDAAQVEPKVVPAEDVHLDEPSLETPSISSDAAEAASLPETAAEVRAVSEEAAEAGKQAGISEPAPEGTEVAVEPGAGLTDLEPSTADEPAGEPAGERAADDEPSGGDEAAGSETAEVPQEPDGSGDDAAGSDASGNEDNDRDDSQTEDEPAGTADSESMKASDDGQEPEDPAAGSAGSATAGKDIPQDDGRPAANAAGSPQIHTATFRGGSSDVAAPVTDSFESLTLRKKDPEDTGVVHTVNPSGASAVPADSRRARRTREAEEAAARGKGPSKTTRTLVLLGSILIVVLLGIWLATVIADSNRGEGVLEDSVSPVELESGACLKDFQSVNAEVTVVTCETAHNAQLVATSSYSDSDTFPGTDALAAKAEEVCSSVIYTDAASKYTDLELNRAVPTQSSWNTGDRRVDCFVVAPSEELTESLIVQP